jgi:hypothetical protein
MIHLVRIAKYDGKPPDSFKTKEVLLNPSVLLAPKGPTPPAQAIGLGTEGKKSCGLKGRAPRI